MVKATSITTTLVISALFVVMASAKATPTRIIYVDAAAPGANDGSSWWNAYRDLQNALADADSSAKLLEVRVARGTYKPDRGAGITPGDREASFRLINGVSLKGGYASLAGLDPNARDIHKYQTVLSGDLKSNDMGVSNLWELWRDPSRADNSYHVVISSENDATAVLDGLTISKGHAQYSNPYYEPEPSEELNCDGGGMYIMYGSSPTLINCTFTNNSASDYGGGIANRGDPMLVNCRFVGNWGTHHIYCICDYDYEHEQEQNCWCGEARACGGGMHNFFGSPTLVNCTFSGNCTEGCGGGICIGAGNPTLSNCILWGNTPGEICSGSRVTPAIDHCCIQGWTGALGGTGNIAGYPQFVDPDGADGIIGTQDDNLRLVAGSPCMDTGNNSAVPSWLLTDLDGESRIVNGAVDMGAYEGPNQGFLLSTKSVTVPEEGTATFAVAIGMDPVVPVEVTVTYASGDADISVESGEVLTFDSSNYAEPQNVTLVASQDSDYTNGEAVIRVSAAGFFDVEVTASELDIGAPAFVFSLYPVCVPEGRTASFTAALDRDPQGAVEVDVAWESGDSDITVESGASLLFDSSNYWQAQTIVLAAAEDGDNLDSAAVIRLSAPFFTGDVTATERDNEPNPNVVFVDMRVPGIGGDFYGMVWHEAYTNLQDALSFAEVHPEVEEIRVAQGIYKPDRSSADPNGTGNRWASFRLIEGVTIKGGYAGCGESDPNGRDIDLYDTILSGDLNGDDIQVAQARDLLCEPTRAENSHHVVTAGGNHSTAVLDGFTIIGGNANCGGGIYCYRWASPTITHNRIVHNTAEEDGGGIYCSGAASPMIIYNTIVQNAVVEDGGGICCSGDSSPTIAHNTVTGNTADDDGGGIYCRDCSPGIAGNAITGNVAADNAGGIYCRDSWPTILNNTITGNIANDGGGIWCRGSLPAITNNTIGGNIAGDGGGLCCRWASSVTITNSILWRNMGANGWQIALKDDSTLTVGYCDIAAGLGRAYVEPNSTLVWATGNIDADPCFADARYWDVNGTPGDVRDDLCVGRDYHLKSQAGRWDPNSQAWVHDSVTSLCIDAGDPNSDWTGEPWPHGKRINMGAYGGTPQASMSLSSAGNMADLNNQDMVNLGDFAHLARGWQRREPLLPGDLNHDGCVDIIDFGILAGNWLWRE